MNLQSQTNRGRLSIILGAGIWGLFWIPLHHLDQNGIGGAWAVAVILFAALLAALPLAIWRGGGIGGNLKWFAIFGLSSGLSSVLYFAALTFTDVIRVVFLFYLLPVWATLLARVLYGVTIQFAKLWVIALALVGLYLLLGGDGGIPLPQNIGDWFAITAGFTWALSLTLLRGKPEMNPYISTLVPFVFGAPLAIVLGFALWYFNADTAAPIPQPATIFALLPISLLFGCLILWPSVFAQVWGARLVSAPTAALLTMSEILAATLSAWYLIGSSLAPLAIVGGAIIIVAAGLDLLIEHKTEAAEQL